MPLSQSCAHIQMCNKSVSNFLWSGQLEDILQKGTLFFGSVLLDQEMMLTDRLDNMT